MTERMQLFRKPRMTGWFALSFAVLGPAAGEAHAGKLSLLGGVTISKPVDNENTYLSRTTPTGGLLYDFELNSYKAHETGALYFSGIELGVMYFSRGFNATTDDFTTYAFTANFLQFPLLLKLWLTKRVSFGLGGYYAIPVGELKYTFTEGTFYSPYTVPYDYGVAGQVRYTVKSMRALHLFFDLRYNYGLANIVTTGTPVHYEDLAIYIGIRFGKTPFDPFENYPYPPNYYERPTPAY
jgi:hypothetical protein